LSIYQNDHNVNVNRVKLSQSHQTRC